MVVNYANLVRAMGAEEILFSASPWIAGYAIQDTPVYLCAQATVQTVDEIDFILKGLCMELAGRAHEVGAHVIAGVNVEFEAILGGFSVRIYGYAQRLRRLRALDA